MNVVSNAIKSTNDMTHKLN